MTSARKLKVYGWNHNGRHRVIVAATSWEKACTAVPNTSVGYAREYGSITGNAGEIAQAMTQPGVAFYKKNQFSDDPWTLKP